MHRTEENPKIISFVRKTRHTMAPIKQEKDALKKKTTCFRE